MKDGPEQKKGRKWGWIVWIAIPYLLFLFCYIQWNRLSSPVSSRAPDVLVKIPKGTTFREVAQLLYRKGVVRSPYPFTILALWRGATTRIKAGEYRLSGRMSPGDILTALERGRVIQLILTIPEGYTIFDIAELLHRSGLARREEFLRLVQDRSFLDRMHIPGPSAEGFLFPDTYYIPSGMDLEGMVTTFVERFWRIWERERLGQRLKELKTDLLTVVTLASIVEKEARLDRERPLVASVYWNRIKKGMPLQADPTVLYGLLVETRHHRKRLRWRDLRRKTPYNTYKIKGLPPGPICNPGLSSLKAALWPAHTNYLYFVAKNDGTHYFSQTLREHNRAVWRYQKRRHHRRPTPPHPSTPKRKSLKKDGVKSSPSLSPQKSKEIERQK